MRAVWRDMHGVSSFNASGDAMLELATSAVADSRFDHHRIFLAPIPNGAHGIIASPSLRGERLYRSSAAEEETYELGFWAHFSGYSSFWGKGLGKGSRAPFWDAADDAMSRGDESDDDAPSDDGGRRRPKAKAKSKAKAKAKGKAKAKAKANARVARVLARS